MNAASKSAMARKLASAPILDVASPGLRLRSDIETRFPLRSLFALQILNARSRSGVPAEALYITSKNRGHDAHLEPAGQVRKSIKRKLLGSIECCRTE